MGLLKDHHIKIIKWIHHMSHLLYNHHDLLPSWTAFITVMSKTTYADENVQRLAAISIIQVPGSRSILQYSNYCLGFPKFIPDAFIIIYIGA